MLSERAATILIGVVGHYIQTAKPVSSATVAQALRLDVSTATVRSILHQLEEAGFMYQPHTSAGRIPTDKGYRFYVDHVQAPPLSAREQVLMQQRFKELQEQYVQLSRGTARLLAQLSSLLAVSHVPAVREVQESGLAELLHQPTDNVVKLAEEVASLLTYLEDHFEELDQPQEDHSTVFIGQEIPFFPAQHTSLVVRVIPHSAAGRIIVALIGPKRMAYRRSVSLLDTLATILQQQ